ncbi:MAG: hypothetical protein HOP23_11585 [Methylococcaceae bacterium]|nr:hypothetical protein [Methylococcaceae bacterium]
MVKWKISVVLTKLTLSAIKHTMKIALLREARPLAHNENVELFDSIDYLDIEELSELYAIVMVGLLESPQEFGSFKKYAREKGFQSVDTLWNNESLGSAMERGCELLELKTI